jgi:RNA polymerase sigma-70 factor (ECF subfamily)
MAAPEPQGPAIDARLSRRLYEKADATRWDLAEADFHGALQRSVSRRFKGMSPSTREVNEYLGTLHLSDLALACACALGNGHAWEHFVPTYRPTLVAAAFAACGESGRELAESMYGELFGVEGRDGVRRSLFDYFHGRSSLAGWLRSVVAQRAVDRARVMRRFEPLPEPDTPLEPSVPAREPRVDGVERLAMVRVALAAAVRDLPARDRLRLSLYYARDVKLAAIGRMLGESEATASRKLARCRDNLRRAVESQLKGKYGLAEKQIEECFEMARTDPAFDLARVLPPPERDPAS